MSNNYRAPWHDYSGKGIYHLTICKEAGVENFSAIVGDARLAVGMPGSAAPKYSPTGCAISRCLRKIPQIHPAMWLMQYVIMPDHLHLLIQVKEQMDEILGRKIAAFKVFVNNEAGIDRTFSKGFNDRIIPPSQDLDIVYDYIRENPRRLLIRSVFPEYFSRVNRLRIGERLYQAYGNRDQCLAMNRYAEDISELAVKGMAWRK